MVIKVIGAEQNMPHGLVPTYLERIACGTALVPYTQCCICQVWFLKHSVSPTYSLVLARLEPKYASFLFTGLLWRKGEDRSDRNRQSNQTAENNYVPTSTWCFDQSGKQTKLEMPRSLTYSAQHPWSKAVSLLSFVSRPCYHCLMFLMQHMLLWTTNDCSPSICWGTRIYHSWFYMGMQKHIHCAHSTCVRPLTSTERFWIYLFAHKARNRWTVSLFFLTSYNT